MMRQLPPGPEAARFLKEQPARATRDFVTRPACQTPAFSLIEIVLALGLVTFSMLAIFALVAQGQKTSRDSRLESVAAILAGKVISQLRANTAWDTNVTNYTGSSTLSDIATGSTVIRTNYLDLNLAGVSSDSPDRQFAVVTEIGPISAAKIVIPDPEAAGAISRLGAAGNTVFLNVQISHPALAPATNRSMRSFSSIITRTSRN